MVHARVSDKYIHFSLMYTTDHIFPVIPIKHFINQDGEKNTPHKIETGMKPSVSNPNVLFCLCVLRKTTANVGKKALNMRHQSQKCFWGILVGITQQQNGDLI